MVYIKSENDDVFEGKRHGEVVECSVNEKKTAKCFPAVWTMVKELKVGHLVFWVSNKIEICQKLTRLNCFQRWVLLDF